MNNSEMMKTQKLIKSCSLLLFLLTAWGLYGQQPPQIEVAVESTQVYRGEPFLLQIKVVSEIEPEEPQFPPSQDFRVEGMTPSRNKSSTVQIINGRMHREERNELLFNFSLIPLRVGDLRIPPIPLRIGGKTYRTRPSQIRCQEPEEINDVGLEMQLSTSECYVGEPVMLTWNWYLGRRVRDYRFSLPVLELDAFWFPDYSPPLDQSRMQDYRRIDLGQGKSLIAEQGSGRWQNQRLTKLSFSQPMIAKQAGSYELPASIVLFAIEDTRGGRQRRGFMDDFFSTARLRRVSVESATQRLLVHELPTEGRPPSFSGIVGSCELRLNAEPREVSVGDPIIATLHVRGPAYLESLRLPELTEQEALSKDFKISDLSPGNVENGEKLFQFTLRARHAEIKAIPPLELAYFDSTAKQYATASTEPIPLTVRAIGTVTAMDAEGRLSPAMASGATELRAWSEGIAANVAGLAILKSHRVGWRQWRRSPYWLGLGLLMPTLYGCLALSLQLWRRRHADPAALAAKQAAAHCRRSLKRLQAKDAATEDAILAAWQEFFAAKLQLPAAALLFADIRPSLEAVGLGAADLAAVERIFVACEAGRYAGQKLEPPAELLAEALRLLPALDRVLSNGAGRRKLS
jgi:hypothetical protein